MLTPIKLKIFSQHSLIDPLGSDNCQIEERIHDNYDLIGGYDMVMPSDNIPTITNSKIEQSVAKIYRILGINQ